MDRRAFLSGTVAFVAGLRAVPSRADDFDVGELRGTLGVIDPAVVPGALDDQSRQLQAAMDEAAAAGRSLFLPPGRYEVSNVVLPTRLKLAGVPGETRLVYSGGGSLFTTQGGGAIRLEGLVLDGANRPLADGVEGLLHAIGVEDVTVEDLEILGSAAHALALEGCSGEITRCRLTGARLAGLWSVAGRGLSVVDNRVADCGDGGILVHRWQEGEDGTLVSRNRIERIRARTDTGPSGHGISLVRARGVIVSDNRVTDCALSAIRTEAASNVQIAGNQCVGAGGAAIRAEGGIDGLLVSGNLVEDAAQGVALVRSGETGRLAAVTGNLVRNLGRAGPDPEAAGIGIAVETDTAVTGNVVESAPLLGLRLGWGAALRNVVATGNMIRDAVTGIGVSVVDGAGSVTIAANVIDRAPGGAVRGMDGPAFVTGDLAAGGADRFPHLTIGENRTG